MSIGKKRSKKEYKELHDLRDLVILEIQSSPILLDDKKEKVVEQILKELKKRSRQKWFNCKMILFQNRYENIDKDVFFNWLYATHLQKLVELQGGIRDA